MTRVKKPFVSYRHGKPYYRITWTESGKRKEKFIPLPEPEDSAEFDRAYWSIRSGKSDVFKAIVTKSWKNLIASYRKSRAYRKLKLGTRKKYDAVISQILEKNGELDIQKVTRAQIRAIHERYSDSPRKADHYLQVIRLLLNYAIKELDWITINPAGGIKLFGPQKEHLPWTASVRTDFVSACETLDDEVMLTAYHLGTGTGQRPSDLCGMKWEHYDGEYIAVVQDKTAARILVYCPTTLKSHLDGLKKRRAYIMPANLTEPLGYNAIEKRFRVVRKEAGKNVTGFVMHGWRYTAAVALAEAGCSDAEIQAVTGHKTTAMVQKYRRQAGQKKMSKQAQSRRTDV